ncbi:hypothetical protein Ahy_A04g021136 isoform D [Arachis hypogaea]|uniref:Phosphatidate cytidylyltransferase n=1 Tax=Arachis hypogaea TaxID=3818 RepID=A0A445DJH9_ARAHY|nr:hypothetical protein Ahy_A04g021136 isoform D [Arachis hypogaea]
MSADLVLKPSCGGCGSTTDLYGSNCKHMTLCLNCGKAMAQKRAKCHDCGATLTRLIREYNVRSSSSSDKNYFIGRFMSGLPDFSKKKSAENKWSLQKDGLQNRQITDSLREKYKNKPWLLEDETGSSRGCTIIFILPAYDGKEGVFRHPLWFLVAQYKQLTLEEAEEKIRNRKKTADGYQRWMMKAANNGAAAFGEHGKLDDKESNTGGGGGRSRKKTSEDDEGQASDKGEEDEDEEAERKNRLGLNKRDGDDDDDEGLRGGDLDLDDDDIEKGDDWEHEEIFTDDDEAVGNDPEEREDLAPEVPAPPEIKQDEEEEDEDNEEGKGLSKSGKELKELLGRASGMNESDAEEDDDDDDDDDMDDEVNIPPVTATKQKDAPKPKEEPVDNSPSKPAAAGATRGAPSTSKSSKAKRKTTEEPKPSNAATPKKVKSENEQKSSGKDVHGTASKSNASAKGSAPPPPSSSSSKAGTSIAASGPVSEEEIRAVLKQKTPVTTQDLVAKFKARLKCKEDKDAFAEILKRISKIQRTPTSNRASYVILRDKSKLRFKSQKNPNSEFLSPPHPAPEQATGTGTLLSHSTLNGPHFCFSFFCLWSSSPSSSPSPIAVTGIAQQGWDPLRVLLRNKSHPVKMYTGLLLKVMHLQKVRPHHRHHHHRQKPGTSTSASGPVSEEEIRAVFKQKTRVTTQDLVAKFKARLRCKEDKDAFAEILKRISKIQRNPTSNRPSYAVAEVTKANGGQLLVDDKSKYKSMLIRAYSSIWMIGGFALIIYMGHLYITAMVVVIQIFMAKELFNLLRRAHEDRQLPVHFFFTAMLFVYGRILSPRLVNTVTSDMVLYRLVSSLIKYHMVIYYALYISGFMRFILTLKKKMYKYQFGQYAWTHMILIVSSFTVASIFEGIFWFLLPATLIVINDIAAYIFGFFFGRTPLIKLSPKKTWEGFIGASISTIISAFLDLTTGWLDCDPGPLFKPEPYSLSGWIPHWFPWQEITILPVQGHALCLGLFASIIAPFGGFFASGFKRAFKIKMVMAVFAYIYHQSFVVPQNLSVEMILDQIFMNLSFDEQQALYRRLGEILQQGDCSAGLGSSSGAAESKMTENSNIEAAGMSASTQPSSPLSGVRKDRSAVWDHFDVENDTEKKAKCKYCGSLIQYWNGTSSMGGHLRRCKQNPNNDSNKRKITTTPTIDEHGALNSPSAPSSTGAKIRHRKRSTEAVPEVTKANGGQLLVDDKSKYKSMLIRAYSSIWMIGGFALIIYMGHLYITAMVVVIQIFMAKELFNLLRRAHEDRQLPGFRLLNWHFFFTAIPRLVNTVTSDMVLYRLVSSLIKYHMVICYALYISGFMWFILTLKKKMYKYQFGQYAWTHMILIVSSFTVASIFEGIFWFLLPATLIVINDIAAYIFGFFFGRTPLIKLSPKKTWEGFIGASISTIISAFLDLTTGWLDCDPGPLFKPEPYSLSGWIPHWFPWQEITILPVQGHALCLGLFASIIAPFGGFFASGFKRAFKIKDFGDSIPGHGGITDRMDCQMVMAVFAYIYHQSFVVPQNLSVEMILDQIFMNLSFDEQQALYRRLGEILQQGFQSHS